MYDSCLAKQTELQAIFSAYPSLEEKYNKIIEFGKALPPSKSQLKIPKNLVSGCQSETYLQAILENGKVRFEVASDALISAGLAALLVYVYDNETPETILKCPPAFLDEIGINASLTPSRSNGLYSIHLKMKQDALKLLVA